MMTAHPAVNIIYLVSLVSIHQDERYQCAIIQELLTA